MSTTLNPSEYLSEQNKILNELSNLENRSFETKKSYILRLRDTTRPLIESGYYEGLKLNDLCSFIYEKLINEINHTSFNIYAKRHKIHKYSERYDKSYY